MKILKVNIRFLLITSFHFPIMGHTQEKRGGISYFRIGQDDCNCPPPPNYEKNNNKIFKNLFTKNGVEE